MSNPSEPFPLGEFLVHHVQNSQEWKLPFLPPIHLPEPLSVHAVMVMLTAALLIVLFCLVYRKKDPVPRGVTNFLEMMVLFIRDEICIPALGEEDGRKMTPLFCTFFFFILGMNLLGMIPLFSTATANFNVTGALAAVTLVLMIFGTILKNGLGGFVKALVPGGVPWPVLIILIPLEFLGLFFKPMALMIRLFANMLAGHIIIFSLLGLIVLLGYFMLPFMLPMALAISVMEFFVAFLQAYIFTLLSAVFIGQMYHPHH